MPYSRFGPRLRPCHHEAFGFHAAMPLREAPQAVWGRARALACWAWRLAVVRGCSSKYLVEGGHRAHSTDASSAMVDLACEYVTGAEAIDQLRLPDDAVPPADAIVSVDIR